MNGVPAAVKLNDGEMKIVAVNVLRPRKANASGQPSLSPALQVRALCEPFTTDSKDFTDGDRSAVQSVVSV